MNSMATVNREVMSKVMFILALKLFIIISTNFCFFLVITCYVTIGVFTYNVPLCVFIGFAGVILEILT